MYTRKGETRQDCQLGEHVVLTLKKPLQSSNLGITVDNFFCSLSLACQLLLRNMTRLSSIKKKKNRREVPTEICCHLGKELCSLRFLSTYDQVQFTACKSKKDKMVFILRSQNCSIVIQSTEMKKQNGKPLVIGEW